MLSFIVPAYNEADNIEATIDTIQRAATDSKLVSYEIIVVDDGSIDATTAKIETLRTTIPQLVSIRHSLNLGLGSSIRSGIEVACHPKFMVVPGDNDMHPDMLRMMLTFRDRADIIATVPLNKEIRSFGRNALSMLYQSLHLLFFNAYLNYINGPGIWPTERARAVKLRGERFSIISELNMKLLRSGCSFAEVPGYMQTGPKARRTVTLRNLVEVIRAFVALNYEVHIASRERYAKRPRRVLIDFSSDRKR